MTKPRLRIACYNIAWFSRLFDQRNRLIDDLEWSSMYNVTRRRQAEAIARVLRRVDADCYAVIEAPNSGRRQSCVTELTGFAEHFGLRQNAALIGFENPTHQEIALLFDPERISAEHAPIGEPVGIAAAGGGGMAFGTPRFDSVFSADLDGDDADEAHAFSKPPLEAVIEDKATGASFRLIAVHLKSKGARGARTPAAEHRIGLENRTKQYTQAVWLRARIEEHMAAGEDVVTLGDFNDGPGLDGLEEVNGRSSIDTVAGDPSRPERRLANPFLGEPVEADAGRPATARFYNEAERGFLNALIDFILLTPDLAGRTRPKWRIWHPFDDPECAGDDELQSALLDASDHFPVTVDLEFDQR